MPTNKEAAQVLAHPNGQRCELTQIHNHILLHVVRFGKVFCKTCAVMLALLGLAALAALPTATVSAVLTLIGAIVLVASGVLTEREAIENMNMSTVLLYVGVSAFGTALAQTGAAEMLADVFSKMLDGITNGYIVGFTFYVVGFLMTSLLYNRAVSTVLIPLVVITCSSIGCDPRGPIILVALSTMSSLVTPMATAVVPMAMNAGGYSAKTCLKVGLIPGVVRGIVGTLIAMTLYPM